jgi:hypothetical protein
LSFNHLGSVEEKATRTTLSRISGHSTGKDTKRRLLLLIASIAVAIMPGCSNSSSHPSEPQTQVNKISPAHVAVMSSVKPLPPHKTAHRQTTFSKLKIDNIRVDGNVVHITGETDLPDSSVLTVTLDVLGRSADAESIAVSEQATVGRGHFSADLTRPSRPEFLKKRCVISLLFSPFAQSAGVQSIVGANGEHLAGNAVNPMDLQDPRLMRTLEIQKTIPANFHLVSQDQLVRSIDPTAYANGSPERALAEFLAAWQNRDYKAMRNKCQLTWLSGKGNSVSWLRNWFDLKKLLGAKVEGRDQNADSAVRLSASIT